MPLIVVVSIALFSLLFWAVLKFYRMLRQSAKSAEIRAFEGLAIAWEPRPELVSVVFHTYYGFLAFVTQTEHRFWAKPEDAQEALRRLHRYNLRWGLIARGAVFIPLLSYLNYQGQLRSIRTQTEEKEGDIQVNEAEGE